MTTQLEHDLKKLFEEEAGRAPAGADIALGIRRLHRRSVRRGWGAGILIAASVTGVVFVSSGFLGADQTPQNPAASAPSTSNSTPLSSSNPQSGRLPGPAGASCIIYSARNVSTIADFALDGTVKAIGPTLPSQSEAYPAVIPTTIAVNEWFHGGSAHSMIIDIPTGASIDPTPSPFKVGTRLLISGMKSQSNHATADVASGCGFTRYYDKSTANAWRMAEH